LTEVLMMLDELAVTQWRRRLDRSKDPCSLLSDDRPQAVKRRRVVASRPRVVVVLLLLVGALAVLAASPRSRWRTAAPYGLARTQS
jgi:hypothetical protein